jgi:hypothetical protein
MVHGGFRSGAGRKTSWCSGCTFEKTKLIRVPIVLSDKLLELAHSLDSGEQVDIVTKSNDDTDILIKRAKEILDDESFIRSKDRYKHRKAFARLLNIDELFLK